MKNRLIISSRWLNVLSVIMLLCTLYTLVSPYFIPGTRVRYLLICVGCLLGLQLLAHQRLRVAIRNFFMPPPKRGNARTKAGSAMKQQPDNRPKSLRAALAIVTVFEVIGAHLIIAVPMFSACMTFLAIVVINLHPSDEFIMTIKYAILTTASIVVGGIICGVAALVHARILRKLSQPSAQQNGTAQELATVAKVLLLTILGFAVIVPVLFYLWYI